MYLDAGIQLKSHQLSSLHYIKVQHYHHHSADTQAPQTQPLSFAYRGSYNSSFPQSLTPTQSTVFHFSTIIYMGEACGPARVREFVCLRCSLTAPIKERLVSHQHLQRQEGSAEESQMKYKTGSGRNTDWVT